MAVYPEARNSVQGVKAGDLVPQILLILPLSFYIISYMLLMSYWKILLKPMHFNVLT